VDGGDERLVEADERLHQAALGVSPTLAGLQEIHIVAAQNESPRARTTRALPPH
jgi:hypothetical protein